MHITEIHKTSIRKGSFVLETEIFPEDIQNVLEKELLFERRNKAIKLIADRFPDHFKDLDARSLPTPEPAKGGGSVSITIYVDVTESCDGALQDAADELGLELGKTAVG